MTVVDIISGRNFVKRVREHQRPLKLPAALHMDSAEWECVSADELPFVSALACRLAESVVREARLWNFACASLVRARLALV